MAILISEIIDFKIKGVTTDNKECYRMIKMSINQDDIIIKIYVPNNRKTKSIKEKCILFLLWLNNINCMDITHFVYYITDESWKHYAQWKKPDTTGHILYDSMYMTCPE